MLLEQLPDDKSGKGWIFIHNRESPSNQDKLEEHELWMRILTRDAIEQGYRRIIWVEELNTHGWAMGCDRSYLFSYLKVARAWGIPILSRSFGRRLKQYEWRSNTHWNTRPTDREERIFGAGFDRLKWFFKIDPALNDSKVEAQEKRILRAERTNAEPRGRKASISSQWLLMQVLALKREGASLRTIAKKCRISKDAVYRTLSLRDRETETDEEYDWYD